MRCSQPIILLATAQINVIAANGHTCVLTALIDQGSQATLLTERAAQRLRLTRSADHLRIRSVGNNQITTSNGTVHMQLTAMFSKINNIHIQAHVLSSITGYLPAARVTISKTMILPQPLADPNWHTPKAIDILLGADIYCRIILSEMKKMCNNTLLAQNSIFGWILTGVIANAVNIAANNQQESCHTQALSHRESCDTNTLSNQSCYTTALCHDTASCNTVALVSEDACCPTSTLATNEICQLLRNFWEIADNDDTSNHSSEDAFIEQHYSTTHHRDSSGRYTVRLPFKALMSTSTITYGDSFTAAVRRLKQVERSLQKKPQLREQYIQFMDEYIALGHMTRIPHSEVNLSYNNHFYLPHHAVVKTSSSTTKVRVVFDASCKTNSGTSLNNSLLIGPTLQPDLSTTLMRWRRHKIAFCADVEKMYRQILVHTKDQDFQRIVWRRSPLKPIEHYRLHTVTYGTSAAPYLAVRTLLQLADDESKRYPLAASVTKTDFYVDDLISGADDIETALVLQNELISLLRSGGMHLRKWSSNCDDVLAPLPASDRECRFPLSMHTTENIKALGITWDPVADTFGFKITFPFASSNETPTTKRQLLSDASRLFDPLGWLAPTTIVSKLFFQKLWLLKIDWDDRLPDKLNNDWRNYITEIPAIEQIKICRWTGRKPTASCQLHGFCDASQSAYAAVVYLRITDFAHTHITLLAAKTRVAPLKQVTLPRLELCGFALLANLMRKIIDTEFASTAVESFAWCDSEIVLAWLKSPPSKWKVFVANRTAQIHLALPDTQFYHVKSCDNPADVASRGISPSKLSSHTLWWSGPQWLKHQQHDWPINQAAALITELETRAATASIFTTVIEPFTLIDSCSSFIRLLRVTAYCRRFINNCISKWSSKHKLSRAAASTATYLTSQEHHDALKVWIKIAQQHAFADEISRLQSGDNEVNSKSLIISVNPFLDSDGILRVGGRIKRAAIHYNQRHPIILPKDHRLSTLLVHHVHTQTLHGNIQLMLNTLRQTYWLIHARPMVKRTISKCKVCARHAAKPAHQFMADLPTPRVTPARPFIKTAVDYAGPISLRPARITRGRITIIKGYIAIFVCMATKAMHLEVVSDLTSTAFLAAFRRFISRRGHVTDVYSDNGTNFVGAARYLREYYSIPAKLGDHLAAINVNWHFSPPSAPHFNGLAESGVKAMKKHLIRVVGSNILTFEELTTVITQIEACLNSRPLCRLSDDPSQSDVLTPGHFLIGCAPLAPVEPDYTNIKCLKNRWHHVQQITQHFWNRWAIEYLQELQQRNKWIQKAQPQPKIGDLVYICDTPSTPLQWPMGVITDLHPGKDSIVRVVTVKTATGSLTRPIVKICWLPTQ